MGAEFAGACFRGNGRALPRNDRAADAEAKLYKAMDKLEAIVQHNGSDIATWEPHEYQLNMTYADDAVAWSPVLRELREAIRQRHKGKDRRSGAAGVRPLAAD